MKYMLLTYLDENTWGAVPEAEQHRIIAQCDSYVEKLMKSRKFLGGSPLYPTSMSTTVKVQDGKRLVTDGPFAETREQLGGYTLIEADNLDEAIDIAATFMGRSFPTAVEIRPILERAGSPAVVPAEKQS
jgi:hypothetical protein